MADILLVHGAWHGEWCWHKIVSKLKASGYEVFAPSLPGLAERQPEMCPELGLEDHILDVEKLIVDRDLNNLTLVVHSYAGMIGRALEDSLGDRLDTIIYLEAVVPKQGQSMFSLIPPDFRARLEAMATDEGKGWAIPPPDAARFNIESEELSLWITSNMTDHPLKSFQDKLNLSNPDHIQGLKYFVFADDRTPQPYQTFIDELSGLDDWRVLSMRGGHELMLTNPTGVLRVLGQAISEFSQN
ncbi:MAG: alpha/beta fold hydrolase [Desulfobulbia bacterium]